jgi:predicted Ser/Thr protein kinase
MIKIPFAEGKRSNVYKIKIKNRICLLKEEKKPIRGRIKNEAKWLKILNTKKIGPKLLQEKDNYIIIEFIKGKPIIKWFKENNKKQITKIIINLLKQCRIIDKLKVNKKELQNPYKHIIINKKPIMIDFEKCKQTPTPKNVTQFCQFITSKKIKQILESKNIKINQKNLTRLLKEYKKRQIDKKFKEILKEIK